MCKQHMDRLGTISESWAAEVAALERTRRQDGLKPNSDPPLTLEFRRHCFSTTTFRSQKCKRTVYLRVIWKIYQSEETRKGIKRFQLWTSHEITFQKGLQSIKDRMISEVSFERMLRLRNDLRVLGLSAKSVQNILSLNTNYTILQVVRGWILVIQGYIAI